MIEAAVLQRTLHTALRHGGDFAEVFGGQNRVGQLIERLGVDALDGVDESSRRTGWAIRAGCSMRQP